MPRTPLRALALALAAALSPALAAAAPRHAGGMLSQGDTPPAARGADAAPVTAAAPRGLLFLSLLVPGPLPLALVVPPAVSRPAPLPAAARR